MSRVEDIGAPNLIQVRSKWDYVRKKLRRRGVVEVNTSHPHYDMLCAIKLGWRKLLTEYADEFAAKDELSEEDFTHRQTIQVTAPSGQVYFFESYASRVFACLRRAVHISEEEIQDSLSPEQQPYLEFISNSRSGADFYFSNDQRFVLKTDKEHCIQHFLSILRCYLDHFQTYPHSLLVKFVGLFSIKRKRGSKKFYLVMQSIFYPTMRIEERFDLKGSMSNRYQNPRPSGKKTIIVLKDKNFLDEHIELGAQKSWFITQLRADVDFLISIGVHDYSLLLGRHSLHEGDKRESVGNLILRMKKSFGNEASSVPIIEADGQEMIPLPAVQSKVQDDASQHHNADHAVGRPESKACPVKDGPKLKGSNFLRSLSNKAYLDSMGIKFQNRRLLLNCDNNLHILNGTSCRYYVGIIDFFTVFRCKQRVTKWLKDVRTCCGSHSTESPDVYGERFYRAITEKLS